VTITQKVPAGLEFNGHWWPNFWRNVGYSYDPAAREITWTIDRLEPAWAGALNVQFEVPQADVGKQGLKYTSQVGITAPAGEVSPADNTSTAAAATGPDLFVETSLWSGALTPGSVVTLKVDFGNLNTQPWATGNPEPGAPGVLLTKTLPQGLTFVSANSPWSPGLPWPPEQDGDKLTWGIDWLCANCRFQFLVQARVGNGVRAGSTLTGDVEIRDVAPGDVDPFPENNTSSWSGQVEGRTYLPVLRR
jgi:hypothetical protein